MDTFLLAVSLLCAAGAPAPVSAAAPQAPAETRGAYVRRAHAAIDAVSVKIDALEVKAKEAGAESRENLDESVKALKVRRAASRKELAKLKRAGLKTWAKLRAGVDKGIGELKAAYDEAAKD